MLHHVPSTDAQDRILAEAHRVLRPGASFCGTDSRDLDGIRTFHAGDDFMPFGDDAIAGRLRQAGLTDIEVEVRDYEVRFRATKPRVG
jgi:SAM-dependent methyltransferase